MIALAALTLAFQLPSLSETVIYEVNLRAEAPKVGFKGVMSRLDSIKALGVNVIWLMPVQPIGKIKAAGPLGSPYAIANYDAVNPEFGTAKEFRELIGAAHKRNMAVIIDWVANHTAWDNPWITAHPEWYAKNASGAIISPPNTNWLDVAELNYDDHAMRTAMVKSMQGWVDNYEIDGFRCDAVEFVPTDFWSTAVRSLRSKSKRPLLMLAEGWKPEFYNAGFDLNYGWHFGDKVVQIFGSGKARDLAKAVAEEAEGVPEGGRRLRYITNHDKSAWEYSLLEAFKSRDAINAAFALTCFCGGTPLIYSGHEVNWPERIPLFAHSTIDWNLNPRVRTEIARLLRTRKENIVLREGIMRDHSTDDVVVLHRTYGKEEALILVNVRADKRSVRLPPELQGSWRAVIGRVDTTNGSPELFPYEVRVLIRKLKQ